LEKDHNDIVSNRNETMEKTMIKFDETAQSLERLKEDYHIKTEQLYRDNETLQKNLYEKDFKIKQLEDKVKTLEDTLNKEIELAQANENELIKKFRREELLYYKNDLELTSRRDERQFETLETIDTSKTVIRSVGNIEEIAQEIKKTEAIIKSLSSSLSKDIGSTKDFKELADSLEEKTQHLVELKTMYNDLYKKLII
jgi:hypothetical protein